MLKETPGCLFLFWTSAPGIKTRFWTSECLRILIYLLGITSFHLQYSSLSVLLITNPRLNQTMKQFMQHVFVHAIPRCLLPFL